MPTAGRIVLLVTSPRLPAGLLTAEAWDLVRAHPVLAAADTGQSDALRSCGATVTVTSAGVQDLLDAVRAHGTVVWLAGPTGDEQLARTLGLRLARDPQIAELELMYGSWDPPGARLLDVVTVIDRLASTDGDPWAREQTHRSLARYLIEEAYEACDAIDADDTDALREELGDVLLQVVLHGRLAEKLPDDEAWSVDDVAGDLVAKLIRRNPHIFADASVDTVEEIIEQWEQIKKAEKVGTSAMDSIALAQPALALAAKISARATRAGIDPEPDPSGAGSADPLGERLWAIVAAATADGLDAEAALRHVALARMAHVRSTGS